MTDDASRTLKQYDHLLKDSADVAAIVIRERLRPVQGPRGVFFPPTLLGSGREKRVTTTSITSSSDPARTTLKARRGTA